MEPACTLALSANFGDVDRWRQAFAASAMASAQEPGQMQLVFQPREGRLVNQWVADRTHPADGGMPILVLDMRDRACGADAAARVEAFMAQMDWAAVYARYQHAVQAASEALGVTAEALANEMPDAVVVDVRRAGVYDKAGTVIPHARWCDPALVGRWSAELPTDRAVVVYCVFGHEVSRATALRLRAAGLNAHFLRGGIDGWQADDRPTQKKHPAL